MDTHLDAVAHAITVLADGDTDLGHEHADAIANLIDARIDATFVESTLDSTDAVPVPVNITVTVDIDESDPDRVTVDRDALDALSGAVSKDRHWSRRIFVAAARQVVDSASG